MTSPHLATPTRHLSFSHGPSPLVTTISGDRLEVRQVDTVVGSFATHSHTDHAHLDVKQLAAGSDAQKVRIFAAAIDAVFAEVPGALRIWLDLSAMVELRPLLLASGLAAEEMGFVGVQPAMFHQHAPLWRAQGTALYPEIHIVTNGIRHPRRQPKVAGTVYSRFIPWLGETLAFHVTRPQTDTAAFSRWMNDERVSLIWEEQGDLAKHEAYLEAKLADPHTLPLIGTFDGVPFGYFELYWAKESRLAPHYDAADYDRGWHVAVGEDAYRGKARVSAWLPSLMHFMFLDDPRTRRIVGEPAASHAQQIKNLERSGFAKLKEFDFPHKRALLVMLTRERFFEERLWVPAADTAAVTKPAETDRPALDLVASA